MSTFSIALATVTFLVATGAAYAESSELAGVATFGELDQLRSQNTVLTEAVKNAELKNKLSTIGKDESKSSAAAGLIGTMPRHAQVQLVSGYGDKMTATVSLPTGGTIVASIGTKIPDVGVVKSISIDRVTVEQGKQVISVPFADQSGFAMSLPGMPAAGGR